MSLARIAIDNKAVTLFLAALIVVGGVFSFFQLGWLEDPDFSVKTAVIVTPYPGASAEEVEKEVTDVLETALQEMSQVHELYSLSRAGSSLIRVDIQPNCRRCGTRCAGRSTTPNGACRPVPARPTSATISASSTGS